MDVRHRNLYPIFWLKNYRESFLSEHRIQKTDSYCEAYCLYNTYSNGKLKIGFTTAVLQLYCNKKTSPRKTEVDNSVRYLSYSETVIDSLNESVK